MRDYNVSCLHKGRRITYVSITVSANNETDALTRFMNWHEKQFKHRRAYDVQCAECPDAIHWESMPQLGVDLSGVNIRELKDVYHHGSTYAVNDR